MNARRRCAKPDNGSLQSTSARYAEQDRWEKLRVEAYDSGNHDMKELVWEVQRPVFIRMHQRLENMKGSLEDVYDLVDEEAKDPSAGRIPNRYSRITKLQDNLLHIDKLILELVKLQSGVEDAKPYDFYDKRRTGFPSKRQSLNQGTQGCKD